MKTYYLDHAATTPVDPLALEVMWPYMNHHFGNASSIYRIGVENRKAINQARRTIADALGALPEEIYFCSGGTEASNWAIKGYADAHPDLKDIITSTIEHHATNHTCESLVSRGYVIRQIGVDKEGFLDLGVLEKTISKKTLMVSVIWANNEIGTIQDIEAVSRICHKHGVALHVDAVQVMGQLPVDMSKIDIDLMTLSAHKFYGPKGMGCLYIKKGTHMSALIHGGRHEMNLRAGTECVAGIVGMTEALRLAVARQPRYHEHLSQLSTTFLAMAKETFDDVRLNGPLPGRHRLPGLLSLSFKDIEGLQLAFALDRKGVFVSTGSACSADSLVPSHVLEAIKVPELENLGTIRLSFGLANQQDDLPVILNHLSDALAELR